MRRRRVRDGRLRPRPVQQALHTVAQVRRSTRRSLKGPKDLLHRRLRDGISVPRVVPKTPSPLDQARRSELGTGCAPNEVFRRRLQQDTESPRVVRNALEALETSWRSDLPASSHVHRPRLPTPRLRSRVVRDALQARRSKRRPSQDCPACRLVGDRATVEGRRPRGAWRLLAVDRKYTRERVRLPEAWGEDPPCSPVRLRVAGGPDTGAIRFGSPLPRSE